jgi:hypothetical protein
MAVRLNVEAFVRDYCDGIPDRELLSRHGISAKELVGVVKRLIHEGRIVKEQYFDRNRKIQDREARQERDFLKSLYHCPVCSHIQPSPFQNCPACGHELKQPVRVGEPALPDQSENPEPGLAEPPSQAEEQAKLGAVVTAEIPAEIPDEIPEVFREMLGMGLESVSLLLGATENPAVHGYRITEIVTAGPRSAMFKAVPSDSIASPVAVKALNPDLLSAAEMGEVASKIMAVQTAMNDMNILKILGSATLDANPALIYEFIPVTLETLVGRQPEGVDVDLLLTILPQMLNALGYSHMHRGTDGEIRRLPHLNLKLSRFFFAEDTQIVKLEGCGVWRSFVEVRGHKRRLWEEPGVDLSGLAPEAFVLDGRSVSPFLADIYALGSILYRLATGQPPFSGSNVDEYSFAHLRKFPIPPKVHRYTVPSWLDAMILKCLEKEPERRWRSATQMELHIGKDFVDMALAKRR